MRAANVSGRGCGNAKEECNEDRQKDRVGADRVCRQGWDRVSRTKDGCSVVRKERGTRKRKKESVADSKEVRGWR